MSVEYAPRGLIGILTPQANTTVEPEFSILLPPGVGAINARLVSGKPTMEERLVEYFDRFEAAIGQFANAPVDAIAIACTGASYLAGVAREDDALRRLGRSTGGAGVFTAAIAVVDALRAIGAEKIGLVSPYSAELTRSAVAYWEARGFAVAEVASAESDATAFHPIYALPSGQARRALESIARSDLDAVVMLGTGMPTLRPILDHPRLGRAPVMSCMLCLAWRAVIALDRQTPTAASLLHWIDRPEWGPRLIARLA
jgi:maleate isomerase